jgi:hypothetical protein
MTASASALHRPRPARKYSTAQAAFHIWTVRRLRRERAIDPRAADLALRSLHGHPNRRVAALAQLTTWEIALEITRHG